MQEYQEKYIQNVREIAELAVFYQGAGEGFEAWVREQERAEARIGELKQENDRLLGEGLFPALDNLHGASAEQIAELEEFSGVLMDWKTNLDVGVYAAVHDALLSLYRFRRDRSRIIRELYMLGMGLYYMRRFTEGIEAEATVQLAFRNEMIFTEASSYLRYFADIDDEETRGYIIRSLHNIALCSRDHKKRIAASARALETMRDEYYRQLAPGLPWDRFVRAAHQQMSINRENLSDGNLTQSDIARVLDSCYEVFKPEESLEVQNIRWLWPYYEMEYSCGYVDLETTIERMEGLIGSTAYNEYDMSGLYANVQLPLIYSRYMERNPQLQTDEKRVRFLDWAYRKMLKALLTCPAERFDDYFFYNVEIAVSNFYEIEGSLTYRELALRIMRRFSGVLYIKGRKMGDIMALFCDALLDRDPGFFDELPVLTGAGDPEEKRRMVKAFARDCGLFADFGLLKMNIQRTMRTRQLFEKEYELYQLHAVSGYEDLKRRRTTELFADTARGHHSWYGGGGYPADYVRIGSPSRQITDIAALASYMIDSWNGSMEALAGDILTGPKERFSPVAAACLTEPEFRGAVEEILGGSGRAYYREIYEELVRMKVVEIKRDDRHLHESQV